MSIKFMHTADMHIGTSFATANFGHTLGLKRRTEIKETFFKLLDQCKDEAVDLLLIAGDLFDNDYTELSEIKDVQKKFEEMSDVKVVICAGNHDAIINSSSCYNLVSWSNNVYIFPDMLSKYSIEALNIDIYSFSWNKKEIREMSFDDLVIEDRNKTNILMLHGDIYTQGVYLPLDIYELLDKGFDYIALGHVHKADLNDKFAYCGTPEPLDFKEIGDHGVIVGNIEEHKVNFEWRSVAKRSFELINIEINPEMSFEQIKGMALGAIRQAMLPQALFRLTIEGIKDEDVILNKSILKEVLETQVFYCEIIDQTQSNYDIEGIKRNNEGNLIGDFIKYMEERGLEDPQIKDALYEGLNILLSEKVNG